MGDLRVLVISANPLARMGLVALLGNIEGCDVVGQTGADVAETLAQTAPDVLLWDLGWDVGGALDDLRSLSQGDAIPPVVVLLSATEETEVAGILAAGAVGLLSQGIQAEQLYAALWAAREGLTVLDSAFTASLAPLPQILATEGGPIEALTPRENEVLQLLAGGLANKTIAARLGVSEHTIKFHVNAIMTKLGAQSRTEAVVKATRQGLIIL